MFKCRTSWSSSVHRKSCWWAIGSCTTTGWRPTPSQMDRFPWSFQLDRCGPLSPPRLATCLWQKPFYQQCTHATAHWYKTTCLQILVYEHIIIYYRHWNDLGLADFRHINIAPLRTSSGAQSRCQGIWCCPAWDPTTGRREGPMLGLGSKDIKK